MDGGMRVSLMASVWMTMLTTVPRTSMLALAGIFMMRHRWGWRRSESSGSAGDGHGGLNVGGELVVGFGQGTEVALDLDAMPEFRGLSEEGTKADGHGGRCGSAGVDNLVNGTGRDADGAGHGVLGNAHGNQVFLQKDLAGCDGWIHGYNVLRYRGASMVITNRDLGRAMFVPSENDPPLVVDTDRVVTRQIALQCFEPVSGRDRKILENPSPVHLDQFA